MDMEDPAWVALLVMWPYFVPHARYFEERPRRAGGNGYPAFAEHVTAVAGRAHARSRVHFLWLVFKKKKWE